MEIFQAIILGMVEGITEFLPISSTGHLIVAEDFMGYYDASKLFTVVIQSGAIAAVVWFYRSDLIKLVSDIAAGRSSSRRFLGIWILATVPAGVIGLLLEKKIESSATSQTVAWALIIGGFIILLVEKYHKSKPAKQTALHKITFKQSVQIGLYQVLALVPGVSRSGATIIGGMLSGVDRVTATAFSFYLGIPILVLAGVYKIGTGDVSSIPGGGVALAAGIISAFITALVAVGWLLRYVSKNDFKAFAYYRIAFGLFLLGLIAVGSIG